MSLDSRGGGTKLFGIPAKMHSSIMTFVVHLQQQKLMFSNCWRMFAVVLLMQLVCCYHAVNWFANRRLHRVYILSIIAVSVGAVGDGCNLCPLFSCSLFTPPTRTRQNCLVLSCPFRRCDTSYWSHSVSAD